MARCQGWWRTFVEEAIVYKASSSVVSSIFNKNNAMILTLLPRNLLLRNMRRKYAMMNVPKVSTVQNKAVLGCLVISSPPISDCIFCRSESMEVVFIMRLLTMLPGSSIIISPLVLLSTASEDGVMPENSDAVERLSMQ